MEKNYYEILEVSPHCAQEDIENAYQRAKNAYSEQSSAIYSLMSSDHCEEMLSQIEQAYAVLSNQNSRKNYDSTKGIRSSFSQSSGSTETVHQDRSEFQLSPTSEFSTSSSASGNSTGNSPGNTNGTSIEPSQTGGRQPSMATVATLKSANQDAQESHLREERRRQLEASTSETSIFVSRTYANDKFNLDYERDESFELEIENTVEYTGPFLKKIREYKGVSLERLAEMTKVLKAYLTYIEEEEFDKLPVTAYARGFVFQYAKCLRLNTDLVTRSYVNRMRVSRAETDPDNLFKSRA